ncbi:MAG: wax ester/triacylglycerol synthase family O-acyltransferase [Mycobacterium sp.]|uniref:wax ester/triacylglycerol synthase family O-acyltransferase n=1 Tax=Mycobacterium sp. TaxID=1785 RepID=UPI000CB42C54|nr:wax ester/triacylglycerol synthase family O-acyltransferase [Mycobacterium sp.]PJE00371.1 MAG: wax ester/triacylglycerol synthase family O-acyltransferase [Mycobacterium sp.]PJE00626.1 MAG: wax ester/triacylglycerol synthase family O-acyltransferase [Mycobacterium sp.]PJE20422.1 MAG: wax ester/triacylglycerol synthase family O-acyltransferase [Mycobacterium sp.]
MIGDRHPDRLSAVDVSFLTHEDQAGTPTHIGWVLIADSDAPAQAEFRAHVASRLHLVPRYRQRIAYPPLQAGRPRWIDDSSFDLGYHVRPTALAAPGGIAELRALVGRIFSQRLDRTKPLWECWLVEGLHDEDGNACFAVINKAHHALVDGISGVDISTVLFDLDPNAPPTEAPRWAPRPAPSPAELVAEGVRENFAVTVGAGTAAIRALTSPGRMIGAGRDTLSGVGQVARNLLSPAPASPLNVRLSAHRQVDWVRFNLADFKAVKDRLGGTVNDVYLSVVAGGVGALLRSRGADVDGLELRGCVPVSLRTRDQRGALGNKIAECFAPMPVGERDALARHARVVETMARVKASGQAIGAQAIAAMQDFAPPALLAQASRINYSTRLFNFVCTNVPGPPVPLFLLGRPVRQVGPVGMLVDRNAVVFVLVSYNGHLELGVNADADAVPDLPVLMSGLAEAARELIAA